VAVLLLPIVLLKSALTPFDSIVEAGCVAKERRITVGCVVAGCVALERTNTVARVVAASCVELERSKAVGRILDAGCVATERVKTVGRVAALNKSVRAIAILNLRFLRKYFYGFGRQTIGL